MTRRAFNIDLYRGAWTSYVVCSGELDVVSTAELAATLDDALGTRCHTVIFSGAGITLLSSDAVKVLAAAASRCRAEGVNFEVILGDRSRKVVEIVGAKLPAPRTCRLSAPRDFEIPREVGDALRDVMAEGGRPRRRLVRSWS